jgi:hypothetical protein
VKWVDDKFLFDFSGAVERQNYVKMREWCAVRIEVANREKERERELQGDGSKIRDERGEWKVSVEGMKSE